MIRATSATYWRAITSDFIDLTSWSQSRPTQVIVGRHLRVQQWLTTSMETGRHSVTVTVTPDGSTIADPVAGDPGQGEPGRQARVRGQAAFARLDRGGETGPYTVTALSRA
jgi:hypothetical protein